MSSETDHPRQRTVAELLAANGGSAPTGRRRRRREADDPDEGGGPAEQSGGHVAVPPAPAVTPEWWAGGPAAPDRAAPDRAVLREPVSREPKRDAPLPRTFQPEPSPTPPPASPSPPPAPGRRRAEGPPEQRPAEQRPAEQRPAEQRPAEQRTPEQRPAEQRTPEQRSPEQHSGSQSLGALGRRPPLDPARDRPTDQMPRIRESRRAAPAPGLPPPPGPIAPLRPPGSSGTGATAYPLQRGEEPHRDAPERDDGPPTMVGTAPAGAEAWHRTRTAQRPTADDDGGPPTQASVPVDFDDHPAGLGRDHRDHLPGFDAFDADDDDSRPGAEHDEDAPAADGFDTGPRRRLGRAAVAATPPGQVWAAVVAQWIVGAIGGAALWVGFRFLWRSLPVVALAAAVLVTVGLVVVVRALLRNNDMRTTVFAVLVGLLLTVSPAILVLLGR